MKTFSVALLLGITLQHIPANTFRVESCGAALPGLSAPGHAVSHAIRFLQGLPYNSGLSVLYVGKQVGNGRNYRVVIEAHEDAETIQYIAVEIHVDRPELRKTPTLSQMLVTKSREKVLNFFELRNHHLMSPGDCKGKTGAEITAFNLKALMQETEDAYNKSKKLPLGPVVFIDGYGPERPRTQTRPDRSKTKKGFLSRVGSAMTSPFKALWGLFSGSSKGKSITTNKESLLSSASDKGNTGTETEILKSQHTKIETIKMDKRAAVSAKTETETVGKPIFTGNLTAVNSLLNSNSTIKDNKADDSTPKSAATLSNTVKDETGAKKETIEPSTKSATDANPTTNTITSTKEPATPPASQPAAETTTATTTPAATAPATPDAAPAPASAAPAPPAPEAPAARRRRLRAVYRGLASSQHGRVLVSRSGDSLRNDSLS